LTKKKTTKKTKRVNHGKIFEESLESSAKKLEIFFSRNRDVFIPPEFRTRMRVPKNPYDNLLFSEGHLFALELKSNQAKSFSFNESIIKEHQIESLLEASTYKDVIAGIIFNFRSMDNRTFFIEINDFIKYKDIAENQKEHTYKNKINRSSIPFAICEEIGIEIENELLRTRYHYHLDRFVREAIQQFY